MAVHIKTYADSARVIDMTNAGKRGRKCRTITFCGWAPFGGGEEAVKARDLTNSVIYWLKTVDASADFDAVAAELKARVYGETSPFGIRVYEEEIRSVDAPKRQLVAGVWDKWSASADENGIQIHARNDPNEWTEITFKQTKARAYAIAAKVWDKVRAAETLNEASRILREAGAKLHGYCAMD